MDAHPGPPDRATDRGPILRRNIREYRSTDFRELAPEGAECPEYRPGYSEPRFPWLIVGLAEIWRERPEYTGISSPPAPEEFDSIYAFAGTARGRRYTPIFPIFRSAGAPEGSPGGQRLGMGRDRGYRGACNLCNLWLRNRVGNVPHAAADPVQISFRPTINSPFGGRP